MNERLHEFFKYLYVPEDGFSQNELMFIIYEIRLNLDHKLGKETLSKDLTEGELYRMKKYKEYVEQTLSFFRAWLDNEGLILVTEKLKNGEMIVYNIMAKGTFDESNKKLKKQEEGLKKRQERNAEIYQKGRRKRIQLAENLSKEIELRNKRRNKKKYGDFGHGE